MSLLLKLFQLPCPGFIRSAALEKLFEATAQAFGCRVPPRNNLRFAERLQAYAMFTAEQAEQAIRRGDNLLALQARLHRHAYALGQKLRAYLHLRDPEEVMTASRVLYRLIGIDFEGNPAGDITIRCCYFSRFYSPEVCQLISALDEGMLTGLAGGGHLIFTQRITEGQDSCQACLVARQA